MRERSFHATLTAVALVLGSTTMSFGQDSYVDSSDMAQAAMPGSATASADAAPAPVSLGTTLPSADTGSSIEPDALFDTGAAGKLSAPSWTPDHARPPGQAQAAPPLAKSDDPEPDVAVKPPTPAPSKDPLDAVKGGTPKVDATRSDTTKSDAAKTEPVPASNAPKTDITKTEVTKTDAAKPSAAPVTDASAIPAAPPLAPLNAALKAALDKRGATEIRGAQAGERRKERAAIDALYAAHGYAPVWSKDGAPIEAVESVLARLAKAPDDALTIPAPPTRLVASGTPEAIAESELSLTESVVAYARQASGARVDPRTISPLIGARPELADPAKIVDALAAAGPEAGDKLVAMNPTDPRYVALREKFDALRGTRAAASAPIPSGPTLKIGMHDPRVPQLRSRFDLVASDLVGEDDEYDLSIAEAVSAFQRGNGLPVSGQLTHRTALALAGGGKPSLLEATLQANMEMWRWMPRELGRDRIEVDVPAYTVTVFHDGEPVATNRVVVGKTETPTPLFSNTMKYLIVNPVWNVPQSIIKKEMMPKMGRSGGLRGFDVSYKNGQMVVKQPSGEKNALGRIKFIFPNDYSVYLHDTPSKLLFGAAKRAFSHGCVRVDQPFDFAFSVLNDSVPEGGKILWSQKRLTGMLGDKERYVNLPKPLPIHIEYFTASVDTDSGRVVQREDIYGYGHAVGAALGLESGAPQVAERKPRHIAERASAKTAVAVDEDPR